MTESTFDLEPAKILTLLRNEKVAKNIAKDIATHSSSHGARIMHVCGSHEHTATRFGLRDLLPENIELIAGPGCPVCVCSSADIREAMEISKKGPILATFGDMLRDRTPYGSLEEARKEGGRVQIVYSPLDALDLARQNPQQEVVMFGVGFETTAAPLASLVTMNLPDNFSILTSFKLTSPAVEALTRTGKHHLDGIIAPGHVSTVVGAIDWKKFPQKYNIPTVVAGFEPIDVLFAVLNIVTQLEKGTAEIENEYTRLVRYNGNPYARKAMKEAFNIKPAFWRGLGLVPNSGLFLKKRWSRWDAREKFDVHFSIESEKDLPKGCHCDQIVVGEKSPLECPLFGKSCTPSSPYGPCMVSSEGTCYIWHRFGHQIKVRRPRGGG